MTRLQWVVVAALAAAQAVTIAAWARVVIEQGFFAAGFGGW